MLPSFDPNDLKTSALAGRLLKLQKIEVKEDVVDQEVIDKCVKEIEILVQAFAEDGEFEVDYLMESTTTIDFFRQVATAFKQKHYKLFVLQSIGERKIHVSWSMKHEV